LIEYFWKTSVLLLGLGLTASIYSTWCVIALKPYRLNFRQAVWCIGSVLFFFSSVVVWMVFQRLLTTGSGSEQTETDLVIAGQVLAVLAVICACLIRDSTCRSWARASSLLVTLGWIPLLYFTLFFKV